MRITPTHGSYFYFSFDDSDFKENDGYATIKRFTNVFKKEFSGGRGGDRLWLARMKCWAIKNECWPRFEELLKSYFDTKPIRGNIQ